MTVKKYLVVAADTDDALRRFYTLASLEAYVKAARAVGAKDDDLVRLSDGRMEVTLPLGDE